METLSQSLRRIKKLKNRLAVALLRASSSAVYEESNPPAFKYADVVAEAEKTRNDLVALETTVAVTNATTIIRIGDSLAKELGVSNEQTIAWCVRTLQELKSRIVWVKTVASLAHPMVTTKSAHTTFDEEGKYKNVSVEKTNISCLPETHKVALVATLQERFDALNDAVETANHQTIVKVV